MDNLLTINELSEKLKVPKSWLYRRTMQKGENRIPCVKLGKYVRFCEHDVIKWLQSEKGNGE